MIRKTLSILVVFCLLLYPSVARGDDHDFQLSVPLLEGDPAPFSGILLGEDDVALCIEDSAARDRAETEVRLLEAHLIVQQDLYEEHISAQREMITRLAKKSWWSENGNVVTLSLGFVLGLVVSGVFVGLAR